MEVTLALVDTTIEEPPPTADETEMLLCALERARGRFAWKTGGLDAEGLNRRRPPSEMTPGGPSRSALPSGEHLDLRRALVDLSEEHPRRTGHADLPREAIGGLVGNDPPRS
jgi:hypothetical protein